VKNLASACLRSVGLAAATLALCTGLPTRAGAAIEPADAASLVEAFRTCVGLKHHPFAASLLRTVGNEDGGGAFQARYAAAVEELTFERGPGYSTATARLKGGLSVAGVPVLAVYAATCERECALALWGLELGTVSPEQRADLLQWVQAAPATPTPTHGDIQVQLNKTTDGHTVLVCDVSDVSG
jgi:hypothetical protein